jgi:hypothetical protein
MSGYFSGAIWADGETVRTTAMPALVLSISEARVFRDALDKASAEAEAKAEAKELADKIRKHVARQDHAHMARPDRAPPDFDTLAAAIAAIGLVKREK